MAVRPAEFPSYYLNRGGLLFTAVFDTREQKPLKFADDVLTVKAMLKEGDYAIQGYEQTGIVFERKTVADLVASVIHDHHVKGDEAHRFDKELERLCQHDKAYIVVEGTWEDCKVCWRDQHGQMSWSQVRGLLVRLMLGNIPVVFCSTVELTAEWVFTAMRLWIKDQENKP
jgi:ERCC4-type nuclease